MSGEKIAKSPQDPLESEPSTNVNNGQITNFVVTDQPTDAVGVLDSMEDETTGKEVINISIKQYLKPILYCLSISGCYDFYASKMNTFQISIVHIYRVIVFLVLASIILKFISAFFYLQKPDMMMNGLYLSWLCICTSYFAVHLKSTSTRFGLQEATFQAFDYIVENLSKTGCQCPVATIKRRVLLGTIIGCFLVLTNMTGIGMQILYHPASKAFYSSPFKPSWVAVTLFLMAEFVCTLIWIFPVIYVIIICDIMKHVLTAYNSFLEEIVKRKYSIAQIDIQQLRVQHLTLSKLVNNFDTDMGWFFASTCLINLGLSCFSLYELIKIPLDGFNLLLFIFWLTASLATLGFVTIFAAVVNEKAHAPLDILYYIDTTHASLDQVTELSLFISKLTNAQVGFTTCGLLTITKDFILTIAGAFLTYFAVLYTL